MCNDGFSISIQASRDHFCTPRDDIGPYEYVEAAYPSEWEDLLLPFTDNDTDRTPVICGTAPTLYVNVPASVIREMISKHGGMARPPPTHGGVSQRRMPVGRGSGTTIDRLGDNDGRRGI